MDPPCKPATELERSASVLARQLAMAKLTGQPPPQAPTGLLEPLPTWEQLQQKAAATTTRPRLGRNNTVTSAAGRPGESERPRFRRSNTVSEGNKKPPLEPTPTPADRQAIGANLIRKLSARRGPTPTPTTTTTTIATAQAAAGDRDGGDDAASFQALPPPLPLPSLPFSQPPPLPPSQATEEEENREDPATAAAGVPSFSPPRSGSVTSAAATTTATTTTSTSTSSSPSSYTFPPSSFSNYHNPAPPPPPPPPRIDPRLVRPLATFGIRAVEEEVVPSSSSQAPGGGGGGAGTYRYRERGSSASSSLVGLHAQEEAAAAKKRMGSISISSMLSSAGGTDEEVEDGVEGELTTREGETRDSGGGGGGFSSSGSLPQDPAAASSSPISSSRMRTDRLGSIGLGLGGGGGGATGGPGPGFFDHHDQLTLSSGTEALRDTAASLAPEGGEAEEGTTPTLAQTSRIEAEGGGAAAEGAAESTPRLPPPVVGSEDPVPGGGGGVETTPRLGHPDQGQGSSSSRSRTPTRTRTPTEAPTATATERARFSPSAAVTTTTTTTGPESTQSHVPATATATASPMSTSPPTTTTAAAAATDRHPSPPPLTKPQRSLALTLSDYHPFGDPPPANAGAGGALSTLNTIGNHSGVTGASRGGSQTPLVPDPISPTSVIPNPMEAIEFPPFPLQSSISTATPGSRRSSPNNDTLLRLEQKPTATKTTASANSNELLRVPTPAAASHRENRSPSPAASGSARSYRSGIAAASVTEEEQEGEEANAQDLAPATSSDSPHLTSRNAGEDARPGLMHTSSTDPAWSAEEGGGGGGTVPAASLPPFEPRVTRLPAAELPANRILAKLDSILEPETPQQSSSPSTGSTRLLDPPPRKLLLSSPVLQVVNANTVKDRYLLLFTDMLVIAKPLIEDHALTGEPILPDLDGHFLVKSVVECKHLKLSADEDPVEESSSSSATTTGGGHKKKHPLLVAFVDRFANDPARAIASLISKGGLANDGPTIANLLYRNTDLNRNQLGAYLSDRHHRHVLRAYIDRFRFAGVRIDDALRLFLMSVRLPFDDGAAADYVIGVLANMWAEANTATGIDGAVAHGLMTAIMRLSDALHGGDEAGERFFRGSKPPVPPTVDDFIASFRDVDTRSVVPEDLLARIYTAVRRERVENASDNSIFSMTPDIEATIEPAKLPTQLTYRTPSARFTITLPEPDPKFTIKLQGADLQFDPPVLSFARNATQSFRVTGTSLGVRTMVLIKRGANAPRYQGLPLNKAFSIERGFMQHTFQLSFTNHLDLKRKYMFSCRDAETRSRWLRLLRERIIVSAGTPVPATPAQAAANAVAVQVLRDALLDPEEPGVLSAGTPSPRPNVVAPRFGRPVTPSTPRGRLGTPTRPPTAARSNSISRLYPVLYRQEAETGEKRPTATTTTASSGMLTPAASGGGKPSTATSSPDPATSELSAARLLHGDFVKSGHELVVTTEQNSLLPLVLTFLTAGLEVAPHPLSLRGSAFQLPPLDGTPATLPSFVSQP